MRNFYILSLWYLFVTIYFLLWIIPSNLVSCLYYAVVMFYAEIYCFWSDDVLEVDESTHYFITGTIEEIASWATKNGLQ